MTSDTGTVSDLSTLLVSGRRFGTIYADPPWRCENTASRDDDCACGPKPPTS